MNRQISIDEIMSQAQVFASAWSLVGGPFDDGEGYSQAEEAKKELRKLIVAKFNGEESTRKGTKSYTELYSEDEFFHSNDKE